MLGWSLLAMACGGEQKPSVEQTPEPTDETPAPPTAVEEVVEAPAADEATKDEPTEEVAAQPADAREDPPTAPPNETTPASMVGERLNPEIAGVGADALQAAFPERIGDWSRTESRAHPAGAAGRWADGASAVYRHGDREVRVSTTDMIRVDACSPGTAKTIVRRSLDADARSRQVMLGSHPAVLTPDPPGAVIGLWLGDRCQLAMSGDGVTGRQLMTLAEGLDLDALATTCARRDPRGPPGLGR